MKNKLILSLLGFLCVNAYSMTAEENKLFMAQAKKDLARSFPGLAQESLPLPDGGAVVVPKSHFKMATPLRAKQDLMAAELKQNGFVKSFSTRAQFLIALPNTLDGHYNKFAGNNDVTSTHMRRSPEMIEFAFEMPSATASDAEEIYGYAPIGNYVHKEESYNKKEGWTQGIEFFKNDQSVCAYTVNAIKLTHAASNISEDVATYLVNKKITTLFAEGNDASGYIYVVRWFDDEYFRVMECADLKFDHKIMEKTINMAINADKA
jgi:hypothetical protein